MVQAGDWWNGGRVVAADKFVAEVEALQGLVAAVDAAKRDPAKIAAVRDATDAVWLALIDEALSYFDPTLSTNPYETSTAFRARLTKLGLGGITDSLIGQLQERQPDHFAALSTWWGTALSEGTIEVLRMGSQSFDQLIRQAAAHKAAAELADEAAVEPPPDPPPAKPTDFNDVLRRRGAPVGDDNA